MTVTACSGHALEKRDNHNFLYLSMMPFTMSCLSAGMANESLSNVPTGPPQQGKHIFIQPGACSPAWSSIFFFAASFIASMIGQVSQRDVSRVPAWILLDP